MRQALVWILVLLAAPALATGPRGTTGSHAGLAGTCATCCRCTTSTCDVTDCSVGGTDWEANIESATTGDIIVLQDDDYNPGGGVLDIPDGVTVSNATSNNDVDIAGRLQIDGNGPVIVQGLNITDTSSQWVLRLKRTTSTPMSGIDLVGNTIRGGTTEAIRVEGNVQYVRLQYNDIDGGEGNHGVRVRCDDVSNEPTSCTYVPRYVEILDNRITKASAFTYTGTEDLVQLEGVGVGTVVSYNLLFDNEEGEDCIDVKGPGESGVVPRIEQNLILTTDTAGCAGQGILVQGDYAEHGGQVEVVRNEVLGSGDDGILIGANSAETTALVLGNILNGTRLELRQSIDTIVAYNTLYGTDPELKFGSGTAGDCPEHLSMFGNIYEDTAFTQGSQACDQGDGTTYAPDEIRFNNVHDDTGDTPWLVCDTDADNAWASCDDDTDCTNGDCEQVTVSNFTCDPQLDSSGSPGKFTCVVDAISTGSLPHPVMPVFDIDGEFKPQDDLIDIGADEVPQSCTPV